MEEWSVCVEGGALADAVGVRRDVGMAATGRKDVPSEESSAWGRAWTRPSERRERPGTWARSTRRTSDEIRDHGCAAHRRDRGHGEDAPARADDAGGGHMVAWVVAPEMWLVWVSGVPPTS